MSEKKLRHHETSECKCPDDSGSCEFCKQHYCEHDDVEDFHCLICGKDMYEEWASRSFDLAKDFRKYGA